MPHRKRDIGMLRLFSIGLIANVIYVVTGVVKQYLIAAQLSVPDVGAFGAWSAQAAFLLVLVPFPAYLNVLIRGFSAPPDEQETGAALLRGVRRELAMLSIATALGITCVLLLSALRGQLQQTPVALLVLLAGQYLSLTTDILLRMRRAHRSLATFMALRNLPTLLLLAVVGLSSPLMVVGAELLSAVLTGLLAHRSAALRIAKPSTPLELPRGATRERTVLWSARLIQYVNASLLRLLVPFLFDPHATGLFFFASIAQIPASLFLSVSTQMFGHALARIEPGRYGALARIQLAFVAPNALYLAGVALIVPFWPRLISYAPALAQYSTVGPLILAIALYSAVLACDCQEYLLRSRGLSRVLLQYNLTSIGTQFACLSAGFLGNLPIEQTIMLCAAGAGVVLLLFSAYSFRLVLGAAAREAGPGGPALP